MLTVKPYLELLQYKCIETSGSGVTQHRTVLWKMLFATEAAILFYSCHIVSHSCKCICCFMVLWELGRQTRSLGFHLFPGSTLYPQLLSLSPSPSFLGLRMFSLTNGAVWSKHQRSEEHLGLLLHTAHSGAELLAKAGRKLWRCGWEDELWLVIKYTASVDLSANKKWITGTKITNKALLKLYWMGAEQCLTLAALGLQRWWATYQRLLPPARG